MRLVRASGFVQHAGRPIAWPDGVRMSPDGEELRQVVHDGTRWERTTWCSREGTLYDRVYDPFRCTFLWSETKSMSLDAASDQFCVTLGSRAVRLTRVVAMAWVEAPRVPWKLQAVDVRDDDLELADRVVWVRTGLKDFEVLPPRVVAHDDDERAWRNDAWRPLQYVWHDAGGHVVRVAGGDTGYEVSARGWVRSPYGACTRGVRAPDQRLWVTLEEWGLVWVAEAVLWTFGGTHAPGGVPVHGNGDVADNRYENLRWAPLLPCTGTLHARTLAYADGQGTLAQMCACDGIRRSTAWERLARAYDEGSLADRARVLRLVPRRVVEAVRAAYDTLDATARLSEVVGACDAAFAADDAWHADLAREDRVGLAKLARMHVLDEALRNPPL